MVFFPVSVIINSKTIIRLSEVIDLKRLPLRKEHAARLAEYGLQNIPLNACCCLRFSAGEEVLHEGQPISWLSIVVDGNAKVCRTAPNGKSLILCYNISRGLIGEVELMARQFNATCSVKAVTDFECIAVSYQNCLAELKTNLVFLNKLGTELAEKLTTSSDNFTSTALCTGDFVIPRALNKERWGACCIPVFTASLLIAFLLCILYLLCNQISHSGSSYLCHTIFHNIYSTISLF